MTQPTSTPATAQPTSVAQPVAPVGGQTVEALDPEFAWTTVPSASGYRLQVGGEADFSSIYFDADVGDTTTLTVYDALPEDGSTCYWRVQAILRDGPAPWSGVAHFEASPDPVVAEVEEQTRESRIGPGSPQPTAPVDGAPVDGRSATLEWSAAPGVDAFEVQVAPTETFDTLAADVPVGSTNVLTIYSMLPEDGSTFYWRVRGVRRNGTLTEWSVPAALTAATDEDVIAHAEDLERQAEQEAEQEAIERAATASARAEAESPVLHGSTSSTMAYSVSWIMLLSFAITIYLITVSV